MAGPHLYGLFKGVYIYVCIHTHTHAYFLRGNKINCVVPPEWFRSGPEVEDSLKVPLAVFQLCAQKPSLCFLMVTVI